MLVTRSHHFDLGLNIPDASWALFFWAGVLLPGFSWPILVLVAVLIDLLMVSLGVVSNACFSPAYPFLGVAYALLWLSGWVVRPWLTTHRFWPSISVLLVASASVFCAYVISNTSFYLWSGLFFAPNWADFVQQFISYLPSYFYINLFYIGLALLIYQLGIRLSGLITDRKIHI